ncbi:MAG: PQQ-dependent sugar dehydrogenase [Candidatus Limnocylindria bacterium]
MRPRHVQLLAAAALALAACGTPSADPTPTSSASSAPASSDSVQPAASASAVSTEPIADQPPPLALELLADGLEAPINVAGTPEGWLLVNERAGRVIAVHPATGERAVVVDLTDRIVGGGEQGLLGLTLHPDWPDVARAFVHYSERETGGDTVVSELVGTPGSGDAPPTLDAESEQVLLRVEQPFPNHNGGQLAFGPDGYLYLGLGDGGAANDPLGHGQNASTLLGSILRLDVSVPGAAGFPEDNPFAAGEGGEPEVFLYGLRNPWRFSFDRDTGLLWIADVGQDAYEEVNRIDPTTQGGANLGWNVMEGAHCFADPSCSSDGLVLPLAEYGRDLGCSVTGGYVYRGGSIPDLRGWYLFGDYCRGLVFGVPADASPPGDGTAVAPLIVVETPLSISSFGEGADGELYVADVEGGGLYRLVAGS